MSAELKVSLAADGTCLRVAWPNGHEVSVAAGDAGALLQQVLQAEERGRSAPAGRLGTAAMPVQSMVDEFHRRGGRTKIVGRRKPLPQGLTLEDLGL